MRTSQPVTTITTINEDGTTCTAPRPDTEPCSDTFERACTLSYALGVQSVRVERDQEVVRECYPIGDDEGGVRPALWHLLNVHTEHVHDAHAYAARMAIETGNTSEAYHQIQRMDGIVRRYATFPQARKETVEDMSSVSFGIKSMYYAAFA